MSSSMTLYESNDFITNTYPNRDEWLKSRIGSIGGSDAACVIDANSYKSREQYKQEFIDQTIVEIKDNKAMKDGRALEEPIRQMFEIDYGSKYDLYYFDNTILFKKDNKQLAYSPDGLLFRKKDKKKGIHEIKTTYIKNDSQMFNWENQLPHSYYIQVLHGLIVTNFDFVVLTAKLFVYKPNNQSYNIIKNYFIERSEVEEDIKYLLEHELAFLSEVNSK